MRLSRNWLGDYVELPSDIDELSRRLTAAGHAVEQVEAVGEDVVLDIDITTNRSDCMNHLGLAREIAVLFDRPLRPPVAQLKESKEPAAEAVSIDIEAPELCRRYVGKVIRGVRVGPSPQWLASRLEAIGLRSINNVVDVTNYVLWEYGQPLHAFDLAKIGGQRIRVRRARAGETLQTLDGEARKLKEGMLIIADDTLPVALAGVMGGLDSEVTAAARDILLESAYFEPAAVRQTANHLGMHTDASHRFERGADPEACAVAARRAAALLVEVAGGEALAGDVDVYPAPFEPKVVELRPSRLNAFVGVAVPVEQVKRWLQGLGCSVEEAGEDLLRIAVPSWRWHDLDLSADLYEEVVRLLGFEAIPATLPRVAGHDGHTSDDHRRADRLRRHLAAYGFSEAINFAFHDAAIDGRYPGLLAHRGPLELANPLSERYAVLRRSLLPNLVESARFNQRRGAPAVRLFEIGHIFGDRGEGQGIDQVHEVETLSLVLGGTLGQPWDHGRELDFFDLKGALQGLAESFGVAFEVVPAPRQELLEGCSAEIRRRQGEKDGGEVVGYAGRLADEDGPYPLYVLEVATELFAGTGDGDSVEVPSRHPSIQVDLTLTHAVTVPWSDLAGAVRGLEPPDLMSFGLKDRYLGKGVPPGAVNTTLYFVFGSPDRSLTHEEVNERLVSLQQELQARFGWQG
jgi:phenylalanyl-tRNA synthetase beta chain